MHKLGTYELTPLPDGKRAIGSKWVFRIKRDAAGKPIKYKARLVARGFSQRPGYDFTEEALYAPVVRLETLRVILALCAALDWEMEQVDVVGAYLYGELDEDLFMEQPEGFSTGLREYAGSASPCTA